MAHVQYLPEINRYVLFEETAIQVFCHKPIVQPADLHLTTRAEVCSRTTMAITGRGVRKPEWGQYVHLPLRKVRRFARLTLLV